MSTTGKEVWRAYNIGPDKDVKVGPRFKPFYAHDSGSNLGVSTWPGDTWKTGGGAVWGWISYDPALNLIYHGTSNPGPWNENQRTGDNKWTAAILARDADTGELVWAFQVTPHDMWDYDAVNENILVDLPIKGATRKALVHFDRNGFAYTIDRATGEVILAEPFVPMNWSTGIDMTTGRPKVVETKKTAQDKNVQDICPSLEGGKNQQPAAFSPQTGLFYVPTNNLCMDFQARAVTYIAGTPFIGGNAPEKGGPGGYRGEFIAWDATTGKKSGESRSRIRLGWRSRNGRGSCLLRHAGRMVQGRRRAQRKSALAVQGGFRRRGKSGDVHRSRWKAVRRDLRGNRRRHGTSHRRRCGGESSVRRSRAGNDIARYQRVDELGRRAVRVLSMRIVSTPRRTRAQTHRSRVRECFASPLPAVAAPNQRRDTTAASSSTAVEQPAVSHLVVAGDSLRFMQHDGNLPAGFPSQVKPVLIRNPYEGDKNATATGGKLFIAYNCLDCHGAEGSGAMGPSFQDGRWHFGGSPGEVFESIYEGRPDGMPSGADASPTSRSGCSPPMCDRWPRRI